MSADDPLEKAMKSYRESLILALRLKDVPGERIGQIVAEVESHAAESGQDPRESFGPARAYAAHLSAGHRAQPWWQLALTTALPAALAGWFGGQGALAMLLGQDYLGQPGWLSLAFGILIGIPLAVSVRRRSSRVRDPRTGRDMVPMSPWCLSGLIGLPVALILLAWAAIQLGGALN